MTPLAAMLLGLSLAALGLIVETRWHPVRGHWRLRQMRRAAAWWWGMVNDRGNWHPDTRIRSWTAQAEHLDRHVKLAERPPA